jgi:peptidoglycan/LPS O-acetylase OafA/YrhL
LNKTSSRDDFYSISESTLDRIDALDWLRGIAASWVLLYHIDIMIQKQKYFDYSSLSDFIAVGYRGVDLFFILSGFVMTAAISNGRTKGAVAAKNFTIRRVFRIFPLYILIFTGLYLISVFTRIGAPDGFRGDFSEYLYNLVLLPRDDLTSYIPVSAWTLTHELMFYTLCLSAFLSLRLYWILLAFWTTICIVSFFTEFKPLGWSMQFSIINCYFLLGAICSYYSKRINDKYIYYGLLAAILLVYIAISVEVGLVDGYLSKIFSNISYAIGFMLITLALSKIRLSNNGFLNLLSGLGKISYSLYIAHYPIIAILAILITKFDNSQSAMILFIILSLFLSVISAWILYTFVEQPGIKFGKRLTAQPPQ